MKKIISLLLAAAMILCLCACQGGGETAQKGLQVGYGKANITPSYSVPLAGYGNTSERMSQGFLDYIYATCIAITDENDSTVLLITMDLIAAQTFMVEAMKTAVTQATGVPADRIMIQGTHTHSAPDVYNSDSSIAKYRQEYVAQLAQAAADAMADRSPATMQTGTGATEGLNFVRHYTTSAGDKLYGDNLTLPSGATITGHYSEPDNEIQLILFKREAEDKKDILAVNWQCHPKLNSSGETAEGKQNRSMISADYVGAARDYVESKEDVLFAFYLGAAGNLNANSKIVSENVSTVCKEYGALLGDDILEGMKSLKDVEGTTIQSTQQMYEIAIDHSEDHLAADANKVAVVWRATNNYTAAMEEAVGTEIGSPYHATSIISRSQNTEGTRQIEINAIRVGPIGFVTAPYEMFDVNGMYIKDNSPFDTTFVMTCANGGNNYIAAQYAFDGGGTYEVHNRTFPVGTAEELADTYVDMLKSLQG